MHKHIHRSKHGTNDLSDLGDRPPPPPPLPIESIPLMGRPRPDMAQMDEPDEAPIRTNPVTIILVVVLAAIWAVMVFPPAFYFLNRVAENWGWW